MRDLTIKEVGFIIGPVVTGITAVLLALVLTGHVDAALEFGGGVAVLFGIFAYFLFLA